MNKVLYIAIFLLMVKVSVGQLRNNNPYYPAEITPKTDWKYQFSVFAQQDANSNTFTNEFFNEINRSGSIDKSLINKQVENMSGKILSGQITSYGLNALINSKKMSGKRYFIIGFEHQHFLDSYIDEDLVKLLLLGNKPFAGETIQIPDSRYYNNYFNQLKGGMGFRMEKGETVQHFAFTIGINAGQNYDFIEVKNSSIYTHPDGDYLDITVNANTKISDTVWAEVYQVNGLGLSTNVEYSLSKTNNFHFDVNLKNLGFITWNGNTFMGNVDTTFVFEGLSNDTTSVQGDLPTDYSYNSLRNTIFKNPESGSFTDVLPMSVRMSGGKYFSDGKFYTGLSATYYPTLKATYFLELFGTWNHKDILYLTPIFRYSQYGNVNVGLGVGLKIMDKIHIYAGSTYLNSFFDKNAKLGGGGFIRLTFVN
ncbi:MAG: hypothetical protein K8R74_12380 [Bacteroidales bacterium]|nr:hypothetical protein [Bacteroidales bacterium]